MTLGELKINCDICKTPITNAFVDGKTILGPWANMCIPCSKSYGLGLGTGVGQLYQKQQNGEFVKVAG